MRGTRWCLLAIALALCILLGGCASSPTPEATPTPSPTAVAEVPASATEAVERTPVPLDMLYTITVFPPSCVANGYSVYVNNETGAINIRDEVPRLMHDWVTDPETGEEVCSMCGKVRTDERS